jgi:hypothetical protein
MPRKHVSSFVSHKLPFNSGTNPQVWHQPPTWKDKNRTWTYSSSARLVVTTWLSIRPITEAETREHWLDTTHICRLLPVTSHILRPFLCFPRILDATTHLVPRLSSFYLSHGTHTTCCGGVEGSLWPPTPLKCDTLGELEICAP